MTGSPAGLPRRALPPPLDPFDAEFRADPYPTYARLLRDDPVHRGTPPMPSMPVCWYVFRHADVARALGDERFGRERGTPMERDRRPRTATAVLRRVARRMVLFADPPRHDRLRGALDRAWTPELSRHLARRVPALANKLVADLLRERRVDLVSAFCVPLPVLVMAEALGVPVHEHARIRDWSTRIVALTDVHEDEGARGDAADATAEVVEYLRSLLLTRRSDPGIDLISGLVHGVGGEADLTEDEILANAVLLLAAGHESTVGLLGNGLGLLLDRPEIAESLLEEPGMTPRFVEECLRYEPPIQMTFRTVREDIRLAGRTLRRGDAVALVIGGANRDPAVFPAPDRFGAARSPNPHLSFGTGAHGCYGAALARREARAGFEAILPHVHRLLRTAPPEHSDNFVFRSLARLPVSIEG